MLFRVYFSDLVVCIILVWLLFIIRKIGVFLGKGLKLIKMLSCKYFDFIIISIIVMVFIGI